MNRITHSLVGYDRRTERVAEEFEVPDCALPRAKQLAHVPADDPDAIMCYPLNASGAHDLAAILNARIDTERRDYFLEGFGMSYEFADDAAFRPPSQEMPRDGSLAPMRWEWGVWIHNDATREKIYVLVTREILDEYAAKSGLHGHSAILRMLNEQIRGRVQRTVNQAIDDGRATAGCLKLNEHDLGTMLDG